MNFINVKNWKVDIIANGWIWKFQKVAESLEKKKAMIGKIDFGIRRRRSFKLLSLETFPESVVATISVSDLLSSESVLL